MSGPVERVFGRADASDEDLRSAIASLEASGARARVEARIDELARESRVALEGVSLTSEGRILLASAAEALTQRPCG
jgi:geranylgeranyl diphosphate synthase type I